jgi:hypothetical protein
MAYASVPALMRGHPSPTDPQPDGGPQPLIAGIMARWRAMRDGGEEAVGAGGEAVAGSVSPLQRGTPLAFLSRCVVVQAIGAAGIVGLWIAGIAHKDASKNH